jgi:hypothetical protein
LIFINIEFKDTEYFILKRTLILGQYRFLGAKFYFWMAQTRSSRKTENSFSHSLSFKYFMITCCEADIGHTVVNKADGVYLSELRIWWGRQTSETAAMMYRSYRNVQGRDITWSKSLGGQRSDQKNKDNKDQNWLRL